MKKQTIYLDTSVINFLFADDAPEKRDITQEFFDNYIKAGRYDVMISPVVVDEIQRTGDSRKRKELLGVIEEYRLAILDIEDESDEIRRLAELYLDQGVIPARKINDAMHTAIATVYEVDVLLSWNYRHLANVQKEARIHAANLQAGYIKQLKMTTPLEVVYDEE